MVWNETQFSAKEERRSNSPPFPATETGFASPVLLGGGPAPLTVAFQRDQWAAVGAGHCVPHEWKSQSGWYSIHFAFFRSLSRLEEWIINVTASDVQESYR